MSKQTKAGTALIAAGLVTPVLSDLNPLIILRPWSLLMKYLIAIVPLIILTASCAADDQGKLTPSLAKKLLPAAASVRSDDLDKLSRGEKPAKENLSPTYWILTYKPNGEPFPKDCEKDLDLFSGKPVNANRMLEAMNVSKAKKFASVIQPEYITECTVASEDEQATGRVAFKCSEYSGAINFMAIKRNEEWAIQEFEWPHIGVQFKRGEDGNWSSERIEKEKAQQDK